MIEAEVYWNGGGADDNGKGVYLNPAHIAAFNVGETKDGKSECYLWLSDGREVTAMVSKHDVERLKKA